MAEFASRWPDMRLWAIGRLREELAGKVSAERDENLAEQIVVSVTPAQIVTAVSRTFMVTVEVWKQGKKAAFDRCGEAAYILESTPRRGFIVTTELNAGPNEQRDEAGSYYYDATVMVTASRL